MELDKIIEKSPHNFVIRDAIEKCFDVIQKHNKIACHVIGGADSDVMLDMMLRCGAKEKTDFFFYNTGLEYQATHDHITFLEEKYGIEIRRIKPKKSIPTCIKQYGSPFWSKFASEMIYRLQKHNFNWEDEPFETLYTKYPKCKIALEWWCNISKGNTTQYIIDRSPYLKDFMIAYPPQFKISNKCCEWVKKNLSHEVVKNGKYDLSCIGVRKAEGGIRAASYKSCFSEGRDVNEFRPIFWLRDCDKEEYCNHYGVTHSACYFEYGLLRTGCFGCPFGKRFEDELNVIEEYEPKLYKAATNIFADSYEYTRLYLKFRAEKKAHEEGIN